MARLCSAFRCVVTVIKQRSDLQRSLEGDSPRAAPGAAVCLHPLLTTPRVRPTAPALAGRSAEPSRYSSDVDCRVNPLSSSFAVPASALGNCKELTLAARAPRWD